MKIYLKQKTLLKCCVMLRFTWKPGTGGERQSDQRARLFLCGQWLGSQPAEEGQEGRQEVQPDVHLRPGEGEKGVSRQTSVLQLGKTRREMLRVSVWSQPDTQNHLAVPAGDQRGSRLDQVSSNMAGIQNSILNTNTNTTILHLRWDRQRKC